MKRSRAPLRAYKVSAASFDHFIGALLQPCRDFKAECLRCPEAHDQLELGRLYDRQVARLGALENSASVDTRLAIGIRQAGAVADQAASSNVFAPDVDRRYAVLRGQRDDPIALAVEERLAGDDKSIGSELH